MKNNNSDIMLVISLILLFLLSFSLTLFILITAFNLLFV